MTDSMVGPGHIMNLFEQSLQWNEKHYDYPLRGEPEKIEQARRLWALLLKRRKRWPKPDSLYAIRFEWSIEWRTKHGGVQIDAQGDDNSIGYFCWRQDAKARSFRDGRMVETESFTDIDKELPWIFTWLDEEEPTDEPV